MNTTDLLDRILQRIKAETKASHAEPCWHTASVKAYGMIRQLQRRVS